MTRPAFDRLRSPRFGCRAYDHCRRHCANALRTRALADLDDACALRAGVINEIGEPFVMALADDRAIGFAEQRGAEKREACRLRNRIGCDRERMQKHIRAACRGVVGDEEEVIAGRRDRHIAARTGGIGELGAEGGARRIAGENAEHLAVRRGIPPRPRRRCGGLLAADRSGRGRRSPGLQACSSRRSPSITAGSSRRRVSVSR